MPSPPRPGALEELKSATGQGGWLDSSSDLSSFTIDFRRLYKGATPLVLMPREAAQVARILAICDREQLAVVPHGGNTSYCGGATPDESGTQIVLSLRRLNQVRRIDADRLLEEALGSLKPQCDETEFGERLFQGAHSLGCGVCLADPQESEVG